jgi:hypothetical protein
VKNNSHSKLKIIRGGRRPYLDAREAIEEIG